MKIIADIKMAYADILGGFLFERLTYDPITQSAASEIFCGNRNCSKAIRPVRTAFGLRNIECWRFLECLGHDNQAGRLLNIEIIEEEDADGMQTLPQR